MSTDLCGPFSEAIAFNNFIRRPGLPSDGCLSPICSGLNVYVQSFGAVPASSIHLALSGFSVNGDA